MAMFASAGDGWVNLVPKPPDDETSTSTSLGFFAMFNGAGPPITMCTWLPPGRDRRAREQTRLGITHTSGQRALPQLLAVAIAVPERWEVAQDHPRRGLVLHVPCDEPHTRVLAWALRAGAALSPARRVELWRAEVYFPPDQ